jgi:hypothetical protein
MVITKAKLDRLKKDLKIEINLIEQERIYWNVVLICNRNSLKKKSDPESQ